MSEKQLQAKCFQWFWNTYPKYRGLLFHIPNGGFRNEIEANQLKAQGVVSGIPDLCFLWDGNAYFFELKAEKGHLSESQINIHEQFAKQGFYVQIIRDFESFKIEMLNILAK